MKKVIKFILKLVSMIILALLFMFYNESIGFFEKVPNKVDEKNSLKNDEKKHKISTGEFSLSDLLGLEISDVKLAFGEPDRIDKTQFQYDLLIYNSGANNYIQVAVDKTKTVVAVLGVGSDVKVAPFFIGQETETLNSGFALNSDIEVSVDDKIINLELFESDLSSFPLVEIEDFFAQIFIDNILQKVWAVRFIDKTALIYSNIYSFSYYGEELDELPEPSEKEWVDIDNGYKEQLFEMTNNFRLQNNLPALTIDDALSEVARTHSADMFLRDYFEHESPENKRPVDRVKEAGIGYKTVGENLAKNEGGALLSMHGLINSQSHRNAIVSDQFNYLGIGVFRKYYTQNFIERK